MKKIQYEHFMDDLGRCFATLPIAEAENEFEKAKLANCQMYLETVRDTVESLYLISEGENDV